MKRRQFITYFGATLAANTLSWSRAARAQLSAMPSGALASSTKPDDPANGLDPLLHQAQALGAPMAAVGRAITISHQQTFAKKDALAVFDISQPSANKRFSLISNRMRSPPTMRRMEDPMDPMRKPSNSKASKEI